MSPEDEAALKLGWMLIQMIHDLRQVTEAEGSLGYSRRQITHPGGRVHLILTADVRVADCMDDAAGKKFAVELMTPPSEAGR
jgi:hypothetical protein